MKSTAAIMIVTDRRLAHSDAEQLRKTLALESAQTWNGQDPIAPNTLAVVDGVNFEGCKDGQIAYLQPGWRFALTQEPQSGSDKASAEQGKEQPANAVAPGVTTCNAVGQNVGLKRVVNPLTKANEKHASSNTSASLCRVLGQHASPYEQKHASANNHQRLVPLVDDKAGKRARWIHDNYPSAFVGVAEFIRTNAPTAAAIALIAAAFFVVGTIDYQVAADAAAEHYAAAHRITVSQHP
jgi:hypothetical protein